MKNDFSFQSNFLIFILCFSWTPIWSIIFGSYFYIVLSTSLLYISFYIYKDKINQINLILSLVIIVVFLSISVLTMSYRPISRFIMLPVSILLVSLSIKNYKFISYFIDKITIVVFICIILSIISFLYVFNGGEVNFYIENPDSRANGFYLTSFSNYKVGNVIRPSFIYDEPGALSFLLCFVVILRELYSKNAMISLWILFFGLITFSLAHLLVFVCFILYKVRGKVFLLLPIFMIVIFFVFSNPSFDFFTQRFNFEGGKFSGDNRTQQIHNFKEAFNLELFLFGNIHCFERQTGICEEDGDISSSIVTPLYIGGVGALIVQLFVHIYLIFSYFKFHNSRFVSIAFTVMLLQRPYFISEAYSLMIFFIVGILMLKNKNYYFNELGSK